MARLLPASIPAAAAVLYATICSRLFHCFYISQVMAAACSACGVQQSAAADVASIRHTAVAQSSAGSAVHAACRQHLHAGTATFCEGQTR